MASKGQKLKQWTAEEKYKIIKPALELEKSTWDIARETGLNNGMEGLIPKKKPVNPLYLKWNNFNMKI